MVDMTAVIRRPRRLGALDGVRALAVTAVVLYHLDDRILPGGFLGVDVFFVLSGYLITSLMLDEHRRSGSVRVRDFWRRRARRLWAAAWVVLALVSLAGLAGLWGADRQATLPGEVVAAVAHIENYWMLGQGGYLQQFAAPSPVRHFWSLAVEEQFYLLWPLVMLGGLALVARHGRRAMWGLLVGLATLSLVVGLLVSPERAYLGTGTRAIALVVGALLAWWWSSTPLAAPQGTGLRRSVAVWAAAGTAVLLVGAFTLHPHDEVMARGGFLTVAASAAGVVGLSVVPGRVSAALAAAPLVWIGRRSYGIYLLHWPLIVAMGPGRPTWLVALVVVPVTLLGATALHRLVEVPLITRRWQPTEQLLGTAVVAALIAGSLVLAHPNRTPTEDVAAGLEQLDDPMEAAAIAAPEPAPDPGPDGGRGPATSTTTTTICVPEVVTSEAMGGAMATEGFDPSTITDLADPGANACDDQIDVLVVGDSTGRGFSNGLASLEDRGLRVWDRTILGCSLGSEDCGHWRDEWTGPVQQIRPDVVVMYFNPVTDLKDVDDAGFLSAEGRAQREQVLNEAADLLSSTGAALGARRPARPPPTRGAVLLRRAEVGHAVRPRGRRGVDGDRPGRGRREGRGGARRPGVPRHRGRRRGDPARRHALRSTLATGPGRVGPPRAVARRLPWPGPALSELPSSDCSPRPPPPPNPHLPPTLISSQPPSPPNPHPPTPVLFVVDHENRDPPRTERVRGSGGAGRLRGLGQGGEGDVHALPVVVGPVAHAGGQRRHAAEPPRPAVGPRLGHPATGVGGLEVVLPAGHLGPARGDLEGEAPGRVALGDGCLRRPPVPAVAVLPREPDPHRWAGRATLPRPARRLR